MLGKERVEEVGGGGEGVLLPVDGLCVAAVGVGGTCW